VIVRLQEPLPASVFDAATPNERMRRMAAFVAQAQGELEVHLAGLTLEIEPLIALASWTLRGPRDVIEHVRGPAGPLRGTRFQPVNNDTFFATA